MPGQVEGPEALAMHLQELAPELWIVAGETVPFLGLPFPTRMTVVRLRDGGLWVHSPVRGTPERFAAVDGLGEVRHLVAPNQIHHLFLAEWRERYPEATCHGTRALLDKRADIAFDAALTDDAVLPWDGEIDSLLFRGSAVMEEAVFFHRASRTLIVADLVENFAPQSLNGWQRALADAAGILAPNGRTPIDWRLSFLFGRAEARACLAQLRAWRPERIVMAHGEVVEHDAGSFLDRSFRWLSHRRRPWPSATEAIRLRRSQEP
ncbi:MAG: DUF4336 domain-containing protein [Pseudomonadales bacterium]|nr:DUF4336 domain-containing protein [Pseudomonadales bacterium]